MAGDTSWTAPTLLNSWSQQAQFGSSAGSSRVSMDGFSFLAEN